VTRTKAMDSIRAAKPMAITAIASAGLELISGIAVAMSTMALIPPMIAMRSGRRIVATKGMMTQAIGINMK
jgi:hypothetical protein